MDYSNMTLREELQTRLDELEREKRRKRLAELQQKKQKNNYAQMSLHDELQNRFDEMELKELMAEFGVNDNKTPIQNPKLPQKTVDYSQAPTKPVSVIEQYLDPQCSLTFNGQDLNMYRRGQLQNSIPAMSGKPEYQGIDYQKLSNAGPTPEGIYWLEQDNREQSSGNHFWNRGKDSWMRRPNAWGYSRVPLQPDSMTNTYGRTGMYIHGGNEWGSAGCIDTREYMPQVDNFLDGCQQSVPLTVKYNQPFWPAKRGRTGS